MDGVQTSEFMLDPLGCCSLVRILEDFKPKLILECGSGLSTCFLYAYCQSIQSNDRPQLMSVEHSHANADRTARWIQGFGMNGGPFAPYVVDLQFPSQFYEPSQIPLLGGRKYDFVFVDGPPGVRGRKYSLDMLSPLLADGAVFVMDDMKRPELLQMWEMWVRLGWIVESVFMHDPKSRHGMACGRVAVQKIERKA